MQVVVLNNDVVLSVWIVGIQTQRIVGTDIAAIEGPKPAVLSGKPIAPEPLLSHDLDLGRIRRNCDELVPDNQTRRQHGCDTYRSPYAEPPFELLVFGIVGCPPSLLVLKAEDAIGHERDDRKENRPGDPERQGDRVVDVAPVRGERCPPPRAENVKQHRGDRYQEQYERYSHPLCILAVKGYGYELKGGAHVCRDG